MIGEAAQRRHHLGIAAGFGDAGEEIFGSGVLVGITVQVQLHALAEIFGANKAFEHRNRLGALLIGDQIKGADHLIVAGDGLANGAPAAQRIGVHGAERAGQFARGNAQFGVPALRGLVAHPFGKAFVQPDIRPPAGRDEIAKPLVRQFMG